MAVIGLTLPALLGRVQVIVGNSSHIQEKTVAYWLAESEFQKIKIEHALTKKKNQAAGTKPKKSESKKTDKDKAEFANLTWTVLVDYTPTESERITQVDVKVGLTDDNIAATLTGYLYE